MEKNILKVQGDIYFVKIDELPKDLYKVPAQNNKYILARGEATGHMHVIDEIEDVELYEKNGILYVKVNKPTPVKHDEHKPITLDPGIWKMDIQREFDYFLLNERKIRD